MVRGAEKQVLLILTTFALLGFGLSLECSHKTDTREWSLSAACWDKAVPSSDKCQWYVIYNKKQARVVSPETSLSPDKFFNCSGKWTLPLSTGEHIYRILLDVNNWQIAFNLTIDDPGKLTVKNCEREVSEGDSVTCTCSTQRKSSPPPVISWPGQTSSPTLHLDDVRGEHNRTYTCEMIWGNRTKTVSYNLLVRASDKQDKKDQSSSTSVIFITAAAVLVIVLVTTVILIVLIRRKRRRETQQRAKNKEQGILSHHHRSNSGHGEEELFENRYYGDFQIDGGRDLTNVGDDYAEVAEVKSIEPDLYAGIEANNERQTTEANKGRQAAQVDVYACVEKNKERQPIQPELYASVVKPSGKEQTKTEKASARGKKDFTSEGNVYAIVVKGAKSESQATSAPVEEMYAQVVKSPK